MMIDEYPPILNSIIRMKGNEPHRYSDNIYANKPLLDNLIKIILPNYPRALFVPLFLGLMQLELFNILYSSFRVFPS